jgi:AcrR family transcriptional regulator
MKGLSMKGTATTSAPTADDPDGVAARIARQALAGRSREYSDEVRRLLDAGREAMRRCGTDSRPRVADIVAVAGLSNDAFYRYFKSKDALVAAILDDGTERLRSYLSHQMAKAATPADAVRQWIVGVLGQAADEDVAATTLAVLWNAGNLPQALATAPTAVSAPLASLLQQPVTDLGSTDPELDASLLANAVVGHLNDLLWRRAEPGRDEIEHVVTFCLASLRRDATPPNRRRRSPR